ncbi:MAG: class I SAM-dependent methyltransferase [Bacteroidota bacterium]
MDKSQIAAAVFDKRAADYQQKFMDVSHYGRSLDLFCDSIRIENAEILEIACGPGNITAYLLNRRKDFNILGIDLAPNMISLAQKNNPCALFRLMDCRDIVQLNKKYDGIMCGFCLPYLSKDEAVQLIADTSAILNPGGILYLSTMEANYQQSGWQTNSLGDAIYMHYHQADYLCTSLEEHQFGIISMERKQLPVADKANSVDLMIIAELKE